MPAFAGVPGHYSASYQVLVTSKIDFMGGVGIFDPDEPFNPCTVMLLRLHVPIGYAPDYYGTLRIATNLNAVGTALTGILEPVPLETSCPIPGSFPGNLFLKFDGIHWRSAQDSLTTGINLCAQQSSPLCFPVVGSQEVFASACPFARAKWEANHGDEKGDASNGHPSDDLNIHSDRIFCNFEDQANEPNEGVTHSHDYSATIDTFEANYAGQSFEIIKNEAVVHSGTGDSYLIACWSILYLDLDDLDAGYQLAVTHDWILVLDLQDPNPAVNHLAAIAKHLGPFDINALPPPIGIDMGTFALQGLYSLSSTDGTDEAPGENGNAPCTVGGAPEFKTPAPPLI